MSDGADETSASHDGVMPVPGVSYPIAAKYCGECSLPVEYCDYGPHPERCRKWLEQNLPDMIEKLTADAGDAAGGDEKKHQKRGGKGSKTAAVTNKAEQPKAPSKVTLQRAPRGKNKSVTVVKGMGTYGIDLKVAAKFFASRFACGSSVTGTDEIVIQGDVKDELIDIIPEKWSNIDEDNIDDLGDQKR